MFVALVLLVLGAAVAFGGEENVAFFDNMKCDFSSDFCGKTTCILTPHNNKQTEQTSSVSCELKKPFDDMHFTVSVFAKELQTNLINIEEDFCGFMSGKKQTKVLSILMPFVKKYSNIDHACPYSGSVEVKEMPLGSHLLASHDIPSGDYTMHVSMVSNGMAIVNNTIDLHIPEGKSVVAASK
ncbi:hypothetical protein HA402_000728 [Bradysia odoriphaga]|nr:hypothetical protein HA402_000728 [Bradysia odoriphaga]